MAEKDCIFCKIANGEIPSATIYENSDFRVILDVAPANRGHALIIPREHFKDIFDIDALTAGKLFSLATEVARAMKSVLHCDGMNIVQNNGIVAGQTVFHFHLHLIPRYENDNVNIGWQPGDSTPGELQELAKEIRKKI
ncbi:MAG: HIT family protein [Lachnospiraceae bacterium]|nr:HIT family protein [Lachnospiraceae bacterium]MBP3506728.1 HIT family protein [Lachnospiraceae bacterium]